MWRACDCAALVYVQPSQTKAAIRVHNHVYSFANSAGKSCDVKYLRQDRFCYQRIGCLTMTTMLCILSSLSQVFQPMYSVMSTFTFIRRFFDVKWTIRYFCITESVPQCSVIVFKYNFAYGNSGIITFPFNLIQLYIKCLRPLQFTSWAFRCLVMSLRIEWCLWWVSVIIMYIFSVQMLSVCLRGYVAVWVSFIILSSSLG